MRTCPFVGLFAYFPTLEHHFTDISDVIFLEFRSYSGSESQGAFNPHLPMFERFSGRSFLLVHASLGVVFFAYTISVQAEKYVELSGRQLIAAEDKERIQQEQMNTASRISLVFSSAFFFIMSASLLYISPKI